jgi:hypothetical protein
MDSNSGGSSKDGNNMDDNNNDDNNKDDSSDGSKDDINNDDSNGDNKDGNSDDNMAGSNGDAGQGLNVGSLGLFYCFTKRIVKNLTHFRGRLPLAMVLKQVNHRITPTNQDRMAPA